MNILEKFKKIKRKWEEHREAVRQSKKRRDDTQLHEKLENVISLTNGPFYYSEAECEGYSTYSFWPCSYNESIEDFLPICQDILTELTKPYYNVMHIPNSSTYKKTSRWGKPEIFPYHCVPLSYYNRFLSILCKDKVTCFYNVEKTKLEAKKIKLLENLFLSYKGAFKEITELFNNDHLKCCYFSVYCYENKPDISSFDETASFIRKDIHDICFEFYKYADHFNISLNPQKVKIEDMIPVIENACTHHEKTFSLDIDDPS